MDLMEHIEISQENASLLFAAFRNWYEDRDSGYEDGIYDEAPSDEDRIAYEFATGARRDFSSTGCRLPFHAASAIESGIGSYLDDLETGLADGTYEQDAPEGTAEAFADLKTRISAVTTTMAL
ncbi:hypothetical protein G6L37_01775 [Agrobacterium rubi]|nr:hypothetical protein [Agrobacterium rubi]NTF24123.1 hypothetical protein [Agrobacterium rubi]